ncbi:uncharacterized protein LOC122000161 [Zingiber officinale]|uniref:Uncharacterized protein n=1 Tax=Zingiber officinale TaxID=94328 RepID=A0A8J5FNE2_ZINOF|nr:uncharacterized protein LOC122000161 [Zingiber officinale]KAG6492718.1 hypothetical protein ZIOFF_047683 [Zingiber officinale]
MPSLLRLHPTPSLSSMAASNLNSFASFQRRSTPQWSMPFQSLPATSLKLFRYGGGSDLVPLASSATTSGGSDDSILNLRIDDILKMFDGFPEPVKNFPWMRVVRIFQSIIFELVLAVLRYLSVPLLAITSLSEMSYCAHERKMGVIPIPFAFGFTLAKVLKGVAEDFSSDLKEGETPWHLFLIASFFTLLKLPGPYYPYLGRLLIPHFANGGLCMSFWLIFMWYRRPHAKSEASL